MSSRSIMLGVSFAGLVAAAFLLRPLEEQLSAWPASTSVHHRATAGAGRAGPGGTLAVLGGMRSVVAGGFWLRVNLAWERRDLAATTALLELTVAADERPLYFWLNGARILAYDVAAWRTEASSPAAIRRRVTVEQAAQALGFLEKGLRRHGADAALHIEMGNIHLRQTGDLESAARSYRLAAEMPGAPYYAARIHGELLRELGRPREALAWLREILKTLPAGDPAARRDVVEARISALELELRKGRGAVLLRPYPRHRPDDAFDMTH